MTAPIRTRRYASRDRGLVGLLALGALLTSCGDGAAEPAAPGLPEGVIASFDAGRIVVRSTDVDPLLAYLEELDPTMGRKYRFRELLDQHLLPLLLARDAFPTERAYALGAARSLREVADNSLELQRKGVLVGGEAPEQPFARNDLPMPVADFAFRPENLGAVSPPIETADGYFLVAPLDLEPGLTPVADRARIFVVRYPTHAAEDFDRWLAPAKAALANRLDGVDPQFADALPRWIRAVR
ncbi:MAG: hypothetical protein O2865_02690 [Planctomycetota bacterium]|nr:hypothetical protein [Planctomycetota bacterium]MDA0932609.1 hypothetical protein [Planctomycetota bacterium]MDA1220779.1 hypothetical protein [Planctomycetota bacterium]